MWIVIGTMAEKYSFLSQFRRVSEGLIAVRWLWRVNELLCVKRLLVNIDGHQLRYHREGPSQLVLPSPPPRVAVLGGKSSALLLENSKPLPLPQSTHDGFFFT